MTIEELCDTYNIINYTINDGVVDVDDNVDFSGIGIEELPLKFGTVTGDFNCSVNDLTTLKGSPHTVGGNFDCCENVIYSLEHCPTKVGGNFDCSSNDLTSLEHCPSEVEWNFDCATNQLTSLKGVTQVIGGDFVCRNNKLTSLEDGPISVKHSYNASDNSLYNLDGFNTDLGGSLRLYRTPIGEILSTPKKDLIDAFRIYKVLTGSRVNRKRLRYVMELFDRPVFMDKIAKHYVIVD